MHLKIPSHKIAGCASLNKLANDIEKKEKTLF